MVSAPLQPFSLGPISQADAATQLYPHASEVSSVALGGHVLSTSDEWFAPASDLLKVGPAPSLKGTFGPKGAKFDGWETRRHNPLPQKYDWVILRLGPTPGAHILGLDVDTANFNGNEAPEVEVHALTVDQRSEEAHGPAQLEEDDPRWTLILPRTACGPSQQHLYASASRQPTSQAYTHIKLVMVPDGGIARFRIYGTIPPPPLGLGIGEDAQNATLDLAHVLNGGRVVFTSDQHFGKGSNLILPGRGIDMGDGWETKRSRSKDHKDWVVIQLAERALLTSAEIDTIHFLGNFPESVQLHALDVGEQAGSVDLTRLGHQDETVAGWTQILPRAKVGPGKQHFFDLQSHASPVSHVRVTMHPDGGIKRVRLVGRRISSPPSNSPIPLPTAAQSSSHAQAGSYPIPASYPVTGKSEYDSELRTCLLEPPQPLNPSHAPAFSRSLTGASASGSILVKGGPADASRIRIPVEPLTREAYAPYGSVIAGPSSLRATADDASSTPQSKTVNQGTASKFLSLSSITSLYPASADAKAHIHIFRCAARFPLHPPGPSSSSSSCSPAAGTPLDSFEIKVLERHRYTTQAFIPMTADPATQHGYLVIVALPHTHARTAAAATENDGPDLSTLRAFLASSTQAISYHPGVWHHPMVALGTSATDFACIVHESDSHPELDCDEVFYGRDGDGDGHADQGPSPLVML
ncbi:Allantoicase [Tilletia horrida]|nr:Allantoicase [Tilletia horrida]